MPIVTNCFWTFVNHYRHHRVVDIFKDIGMEALAADLGMGAWVVRGAIGEEHTLEWHRQFIDTLTSTADRDGVRVVHLKGTKKCGTARSSVRLGFVRASMITRALLKPPCSRSTKLSLSKMCLIGCMIITKSTRKKSSTRLWRTSIVALRTSASARILIRTPCLDQHPTS